MTAFPSSFPGRFGRSASALERAQDLIYEAWEACGAKDQIRLAREALAISDQCADAHVLLAEVSASDVAEARCHYERGVAAGEAALGPDTFERAAGHFWGILKTRPYIWMKTPGAVEWLKREVETLRAAAKGKIPASA